MVREPTLQRDDTDDLQYRHQPFSTFLSGTGGLFNTVNTASASKNHA